MPQLGNINPIVGKTDRPHLPAKFKLKFGPFNAKSHEIVLNIISIDENANYDMI